MYLGFSLKGINEVAFNNYTTENHPSLQPGILVGMQPSEPLMSSQMYKIGVWKIEAPLYQQVFRWFREKHLLSFTIKRHFNCYNLVEVLQYDTILDNNDTIELEGLEFKDCSTFEEAEIVCLDFLISKIK